MTTLPETTLLFYEDGYRREAEVWVDALVEDERFGPCLVLSETLCHPHGGGQKGDRATLVLPPEDEEALGIAGPLVIADTRRVEGRILHLVDGGLEAGKAAGVLEGSRAYTLRLDWDFRHRQMRLHSAAHLLHCFVEREVGEAVGYPETSDLQPDFGLNRYALKELLTPGQLDSILAELNAFTAEGHIIDTWPDPDQEGFRYWKCAEWVIPCGGTHPANSSEIGPVEGKLSLKRGRTGITFRLGGG